MPETQKTAEIVRCSCGSVELEASGTPIMVTACYCDDCQEGGRHIEALPNAQPVLDADGGTGDLMYRRDRVECTRGAELLREYRLKEESPTARVVATCCNSAMYLDFEKGHWLSVYRARFVGDVPPLEMRVQTKFVPENTIVADDVPCYPGYPLRFVVKLVAARISMLLRR